MKPTLQDLHASSGVIPTLLSRSKLWTTPVEAMTAYQMQAFFTRQELEGNEVKASHEIATAAGLVSARYPHHWLTAYATQCEAVLTKREFQRRLQSLHPSAADGLVFGFEMRLKADEVTSLTWTDVKNMRAYDLLTNVAAEVIKQRPRHLHSPYVFWTIGKTASPLPLLGLEALVFDAFELTWSQAREAYLKLYSQE